jgi:hypothetical protein|tara:strand:+ start:2297 stop:4126 length:1830 start_codon:yes stop_codon:yes gene_type:complete
MPKTLPDGKIEVEKGDTLWDIYGSDWKNASGYSGDPKKLKIGSVLPAVQKKDPVSTLSTDDGEDILDQTKKKFDTQYGFEDDIREGDTRINPETGIKEVFTPEGTFAPVDVVTDKKGEEVTTDVGDKDVEDTETGYSFEEAQEIWGNDFTGIRRGADGLFYPDSSAYERAGIKGLETDEDLEDLTGEVDEADQLIEDEYAKWQGYNVETDPAFISQTNAITAQYDILRRQMEQKNKARQRAIETMGFRHGTRQYAGAIQLGIEGEELKQAGQRIADITAQELAAKSEARIAFENNEYTRFSQKVDVLQGIRQNKADALTAYNESLIAASKAMTDQIKEEREAAKDERERQESTTENLSHLALTSLTGDSEADMAMLQSLADQYEGIDVNMLSSQVVKLQTDMENDLMTSDIKEYRLAVSQGYEGLFRDWQKEQKSEKIISGGGGSKFRLDPKTGKYTMVIAPIWKETTTLNGDPLFVTEDGEEIDITTVAGIKRTIEIGKERNEPVSRADMKAFIDENTKALTVGSIDGLLDEAFGVESPKEESVIQIQKVFANLSKLKELGTSQDKAREQILAANKLTETTQLIEDLLDNVYGKEKVGKFKKFFGRGA